MQGRAALKGLLDGVMATRADLARPIPIFLKIAPDLEDDALAEIAEVAQATGIAGIIATNTTLAREGLASQHRGEAGGLSGAPLFARSTQVLARLYQLTGGTMPLIGVGGVASAEQAWEKLRAGASAVQLYSGLVYGGISLAARIARGLEARARAEWVAKLSEITGSGVKDWV